MTFRIPPLVLVAIIMMITLAAEALMFGWHPPSLAALAVAATLMVPGLLLPVLATVRFVAAGTTVDPRDPARSEALVTTGVYRHTRNPMYLAFLLWLLALAILLHSPVGMLGGVLFFERMQRAQIPAEEAALAARFGDAFRQYCRTVRRWC